MGRLVALRIRKNLLTMDSRLKILQWNCRVLRPNKDELLDYAHQNQPDIIALQEARYPNTGPLHLTGYKFPPLYQNNGATAVYTKLGVTATEIDTKNTDLINSTGIQVNLDQGQKIKLVNVYVNDTQKYNQIPQTHLNEIFQSGDIIVGDFNARSPLWDAACDAPNKGGEMIEETLDLTRKVVLNNGEPTHYFCQGRVDKTNALDISACSPELAVKAQWEVSSDNPLGSDHFPILITLANTTIENEDDQSPTRINVKNADWALFHQLTKVDQIWDNTDTLEEKTEKLTNVVIDAIKKSTPNNGNKKFPLAGKTWWNQECRQKIGARNRTLRQWKRHKTIDNRREFLQAKTAAKKAVANAKKEDWQKYNRE